MRNGSFGARKSIQKLQQTDMALSTKHNTDSHGKQDKETGAVEALARSGGLAPRNPYQDDICSDYSCEIDLLWNLTN